MESPAPSAALEEFRGNVSRVEGLMNFDRVVLDLVLGSVEKYVDRTEAFFRQHVAKDLDARIHPSLSAAGLLANLRAMRSNRSLARPYTGINNQGLVLLVSYFGSSVRSLLRAALLRRLMNRDSQELLDMELKVSVGEISDPDARLHSLVVDKVLESKGVSFQDMKSIGRSLERFTGFSPVQDQRVNDIIVGLAARHAIVHAGAVVDEKMIAQLRDAMPRTVKLELKLGEPIEFGSQEVMNIAAAMTGYLESAVAGAV